MRQRSLAMWSGPRCLSTALMRSWENRADTKVWDEPFYAAYLASSGLEHPLREAVINAGEPDWRAVAERCSSPAPGGGEIHFQKHMTHHQLPSFDRSWYSRVDHAFLIRDPRRILASYVKSRAEVSLADIGMPQQVEIFDEVCRRIGRVPPVIEASELRADPEGLLRALCTALNIDWDPAMLAWPAGARESDGVWAPAWYAAVLQSTCFTPPAAPRPLPAELEPIAEAALPDYDHLARHRLHAK